MRENRQNEATLSSILGTDVKKNKYFNIFLFTFKVLRTEFNCCTRVVPKVMSNFFFACELGTADEGECGGRWNQLLCYP